MQRMVLSLDKDLLVAYLRHQLDSLFPDGLDSAEIGNHVGQVLEKLEYCISKIDIRYFWTASKAPYFNHLNSDQYSMFLYILSNTLHKNGADIRLCEKVFYLNKQMHGIDVFYEVDLPDIFCFSHCTGTVLGRARYSDYFLIYQNCTIGAGREAGSVGKNEYPDLGKFVSVYRGGAILGRCRIGDNCKISADSSILDEDLEANKIYIGTPRGFLVKENRHPDPIWI